MKLIDHHAIGPVQAIQLGYSPIGPPMMSVYFYHLGDILIDTGQSNMRRHALKAVHDLPVRQILLTHHHEDHSGNAAAFQEQTKAVVLGHPHTAAKLEAGYRIMPYQHLIWGRTSAVRMNTLPHLIETAHYTLIPIETPGHSKDHVAYLERNEGWLFSGDLFIGERIKFFRSDENIHDQIDSIETVLRMDFDALFCAHNPYPTNGKKHLRNKLDFLLTLRDQVQNLFRQGYPDGEIIRRLDPGTDRKVKWITMGNASFANMVRSALKPEH